MDVICLESDLQDIACDLVNNFYEEALKGKVRARNILKKCFESDWQTIKERFNCEGSTWYVWYMVGNPRVSN